MKNKHSLIMGDMNIDLPKFERHENWWLSG